MIREIIGFFLPLVQAFDAVFGTNWASPLETAREKLGEDIDAMTKKLEELPLAAKTQFDILAQNMAAFQDKGIASVDMIKSSIQELPQETRTAILEELPKNFNSAAEWAAMDMDKIKESINTLPVDTQEAILGELGALFKEASEYAQQELKLTQDVLNGLPDETREAITKQLPAGFTTFKELAAQDIQKTVDLLNQMPENSKQAIVTTLPENFAEMAEAAGVDISGIEDALNLLPHNTERAVTVELPDQFDIYATEAKEEVKTIEEKIKNVPKSTDTAITKTLPHQFTRFGDLAKKDVKKVDTDIAALPNTMDTGMQKVGQSGSKGFGTGVNSLFERLRGFTVGPERPFSTLPRFAKGGLVPGAGNKDTEAAMLTPGEYVVQKKMVDKYGVALLEKLNGGTLRLDAPVFSAPINTQASAAPIVKQENEGSVYNNTYSINVSVKSEANPDQIARAVMTQIKSVDAQRIRGNRF
jgi:hypothetical protein